MLIAWASRPLATIIPAFSKKEKPLFKNTKEKEKSRFLNTENGKFALQRGEILTLLEKYGTKNGKIKKM
ncbi:MAG: hypothetical protein IJW22_09365 [Clostridia bacterium]|nr:hypothetical protein [Clostridia bacterium]